MRLTQCVFGCLLLLGLPTRAQAQCQNVTGTWSVVAINPGPPVNLLAAGTFPGTLTIIQTGCTLAGSIYSGDQISGSISGSSFTFDRVHAAPGFANCTGTGLVPAQNWSGTVSADGLTMSGTLFHPTCGPDTWTATRLTPPPVCGVDELSPKAFSDAIFEDAAPDAPPQTLRPPYVAVALDRAMSALKADVLAMFNVKLERTSGYRPFSYQQHLYELKDRRRRLLALSHDQQISCSDLTARVDGEIKKHFPKVKPGDLPPVGPAKVSAHISLPSLAIDLANPICGAYAPPCLTIDQAQFQLDQLAFRHALYRPYYADDPFHFEMLILSTRSNDFDGDGKTDLTVYRPSAGQWYGLKSSTGNVSYSSQAWGLDTDIPVAGDFDGDGPPDIAVYRPSTGTWYVLQSSTNFTSYVSQQWGISTDIPVSQRP